MLNIKATVFLALCLALVPKGHCEKPECEDIMAERFREPLMDCFHRYVPEVVVRASEICSVRLGQPDIFSYGQALCGLPDQEARRGVENLFSCFAVVVPSLPGANDLTHAVEMEVDKNLKKCIVEVLTEGGLEIPDNTREKRDLFKEFGY